jgi:hypothetical protein
MSKQEFPPGWDETRIQSLLAELDQRTEDEWAVGDKAAAAEGDAQAVVTFPVALLPAIRRLLVGHKTAS